MTSQSKIERPNRSKEINQLEISGIIMVKRLIEVYRQKKKRPEHLNIIAA